MKKPLLALAGGVAAPALLAGLATAFPLPALFFRLAAAVEALIPIATRVGHLRTRPGPRDQARREARSCYDHLAGRLAVCLLERWLAGKVLRQSGETLNGTRSRQITRGSSLATASLKCAVLSCAAHPASST